ncbi:hypothetical protein BC834DRAFT_821210 [Gloeopeniophorella convolvens]|nr:hypothetical protein BC834DRAFT_821210 [Gloeopeniophorella convolvens]
MTSASLSSALIFSAENAYQKSTLAHLYRTSSIIKSASSIRPPPPEIRVYIKDLASAANNTANENACGSILAGQGSESDEYGDVGVWLGDGSYSEGNETNILRALNLYESGQEPTPGQLEPSTSLPSTFKPSSSDELDKLSFLLAKLHDKFYFTVKAGLNGGGSVLHFLIGRLDEGIMSGWVGLVGIDIAPE